MNNPDIENKRPIDNLERNVYVGSAIAGVGLALLGNLLGDNAGGTLMDLGAVGAAGIHTMGAIKNELELLFPEVSTSSRRANIKGLLVHSATALGLFALIH